MARETLKISSEIYLPRDAVTQTLAAIGRKGAGKTYLSQMIAEQMLDIKAQIVVIDPVGNWWGLRVSQDGKHKGKEIFVIGGDHGDVPLVPEAGKKIAQLIVEKGISAVLDVSGFGIGERKRFCADFGEEFFHLKKKKRTPVHVFLEEAQLIVPQRMRPEETRMYSAFEQIVRLGRNYGIGATLITQRPQSVNKEVLSQVECLCVLQVTGPHERKALEYWVQEAGIDTPRDLVGRLPGLERGEGYVWSPSWLKKFEHVRFSKKQTFDASATPELGKKAHSTSLSSVDVERLKQDMADVVEQAEKDDPTTLRRKIAQLEKQIADKGGSVPQKEIDKALIMQAKAFEEERAMYRYSLTVVSGVLKEISELTKRKDVLDLVGKGGNVVLGKPSIQRVITPQVVDEPKEQDAAYVQTNVDTQSDMTITGPEQRVLNAIAWMEGIHVPQPEKAAAAFVAGYSPRSSGFQNSCGSLRSKGLVEYIGGNIALTDAGRECAEYPDVMQSITNEDLQGKVLAKLPGPERAILNDLIQNHTGDPIRKEDTADRIGKSVASSGFQNACGRLRTLGLIEYPVSGSMRAAGILFPL